MTDDSTGKSYTWEFVNGRLRNTKSIELGSAKVNFTIHSQVLLPPGNVYLVASGMLEYTDVLIPVGGLEDFDPDSRENLSKFFSDLRELNSARAQPFALSTKDREDFRRRRFKEGFIQLSLVPSEACDLKAFILNFYDCEFNFLFYLPVIPYFEDESNTYLKVVGIDSSHEDCKISSGKELTFDIGDIEVNLHDLIDKSQEVFSHESLGSYNLIASAVWSFIRIHGSHKLESSIWTMSRKLDAASKMLANMHNSFKYRISDSITDFNLQSSFLHLEMCVTSLYIVYKIALEINTCINKNHLVNSRLVKLPKLRDKLKKNLRKFRNVFEHINNETSEILNHLELSDKLVLSYKGSTLDFALEIPRLIIEMRDFILDVVDFITDELDNKKIDLQIRLLKSLDSRRLELTNLERLSDNDLDKNQS